MLNDLDYKDSKLSKECYLYKIPCFPSSVQSQKNNGVILLTEEVTEELNYFPQVNFSQVIKYKSEELYCQTVLELYEIEVLT